MSFHAPEALRIKFSADNPFYSDESFGNNGMFRLKLTKKDNLLMVVSDGMGWEHVSVSLPHRVPRYDELMMVKAFFWDETDCVVHYFPPKSDHVNNHDYCLHLWRKVGGGMDRPPSVMVGLKELDE